MTAHKHQHQDSSRGYEVFGGVVMLFIHKTSIYAFHFNCKLTHIVEQSSLISIKKPRIEALTGADAAAQALLHVLCDLPHHAGVCRHVGQLQFLVAQRERQVAQREAVVARCIGVVDEGHLLPQDDQDGREEQRQSDLHQRDQNLTFLQIETKSGIEDEWND